MYHDSQTADRPQLMQARKKHAQAERSAAMRARLIAAAKASLLDSGYGRTTAVEVCARASVTRGALFHHFSGLSALFAATLEEVCADIGRRSHEAAERSDPHHAIAAYVETAWAGFGHPNFKIVIEVWLAARNDPSLRRELDPVIERFRRAATPQLNDKLAAKVGRSVADIAFYRLVLEAMIGMALGRAVAPGSMPMGHEDQVITLLKQLAHSRSKR
jgi:AcrR family transcriptional regulator